MHAHLAESWRMTGATVVVEDFGTTMGRGWDAAGEEEHRIRNARWRRVAFDMMANGGIDLVFLVALDDVLEDETLICFRTLGAKLVLYHVDMLTQWYRSIRSSRFMDLICHASDDHVEFFRKRGIRTLRFGFGAAPPSADEMNLAAIHYDGVLYMGSPWPYRQLVLRHIVQSGLPLRIYGNNWHSSYPWPATLGAPQKLKHDLRFYMMSRVREEGWPLVGRMMRRLIDRNQATVHLDTIPADVVRGRYETGQFAALVRGAAINIGFTQMDIDPRHEHPRQIRLRDFEVPAVGGFYLAQFCPELSRYYDIGREIAVWDRFDDVLDRIRYYLARPEERVSIASAGRKRVLRNHTWLHRFAIMAKELGMRLPIQIEHELSVA
jgi:hypothetical protein